MVDDTYDQLIHIVPYKSSDVWWEPPQIKYHPVQDQFFESIEIGLTEADGTVVQLPGNRCVEARLHFRSIQRIYRQYQCSVQSPATDPFESDGWELEIGTRDTIYAYH